MVLKLEQHQYWLLDLVSQLPFHSVAHECVHAGVPRWWHHWELQLIQPLGRSNVATTSPTVYDFKTKHFEIQHNPTGGAAVPTQHPPAWILAIKLSVFRIFAFCKHFEMLLDSLATANSLYNWYKVKRKWKLTLKLWCRYGHKTILSSNWNGPKALSCPTLPF